MLLLGYISLFYARYVCVCKCFCSVILVLHLVPFSGCYVFVLLADVFRNKPFFLISTRLHPAHPWPHCDYFPERDTRYQVSLKSSPRQLSTRREQRARVPVHRGETMSKPNGKCTTIIEGRTKSQPQNIRE